MPFEDFHLCQLDSLSKSSFDISYNFLATVIAAPCIVCSQICSDFISLLLQCADNAFLRSRDLRNTIPPTGFLFDIFIKYALEF